MSDIVNYVEGLDLFGIKAKQIPCLTGNGEPSAESALKIGLLYINEDNGDMYKCINGTNGLVWSKMTSSSATNNPVFFISAAPNDTSMVAIGKYPNSTEYTTLEEVVDAYISGRAYIYNNGGVKRITELFIISDTGIADVGTYFGVSSIMPIYGSTKQDLYTYLGI